jgi:hypothetical protein
MPIVREQARGVRQRAIPGLPFVAHLHDEPTWTRSALTGGAEHRDRELPFIHSEHPQQPTTDGH